MHLHGMLTFFLWLFLTSTSGFRIGTFHADERALVDGRASIVGGEPVDGRELGTKAEIPQRQKLYRYTEPRRRLRAKSRLSPLARRGNDEPKPSPPQDETLGRLVSRPMPSSHGPSSSHQPADSQEPSPAKRAKLGPSSMAGQEGLELGLRLGPPHVHAPTAEEQLDLGLRLGHAQTYQLRREKQPDLGFRLGPPQAPRLAGEEGIEIGLRPGPSHGHEPTEKERSGPDSPTSTSTSSSTSSTSKRKSGKDADPISHSHMIPQNPHRHNFPSETRNAVLYHTVTPNPHRQMGVTNIKTGLQFYTRRITDGPHVPRMMDQKLEHMDRWNPHQAIAMSPGQKDGYSMIGMRPARYETRKTTGQAGFSVYPEFYRIAPKPPHQLPPGTRPWTMEDLRRSLIRQQRYFPFHEAGQEDSVYAALDKHMRAMCNTEQCKTVTTHASRAPRWRRPAGPRR